MKHDHLTLVAKRSLTHDVTELTLLGDMVAEMLEPGQFLHILPPRTDLILRRPISISTVDLDQKSCTLVLRAQGSGTRAITDLPVGHLLDALGPLGHGFPIDFLKAGDRVLLIGGGIGIPPLLGLAQRLKFEKVTVTTLLGFSDASAIFYEHEFRETGKVHISTDDGSFATAGTVSTLLELFCKNETYQAVYACGPRGLNRMVNARFLDHPHAYVSLEERMACGIGACAGCTVETADRLSNRKVCSDGPVFKTGEVLP